MKNTLRNWLKPIGFRFLTHPRINFLAARLHQQSPHLFKTLLGNSPFPYVGTLHWEYQQSQTLKLYSDGKDSMVSALYSAKHQNAKHLELDEVQCWLQCHPTDGQPFYVMDIGANTGLYSILSGLHCPTAQVIAFEPIPRIQTYLQRNIRLNQLKNRVKLRQEAVSNHKGQGTFYLVRSLTLPLGSSENEDFKQGQAPTEAISVQFCKLDDLWPQLHWPRLDLVKIDTESTEPQVIAGMLGLIQAHQPVIFCEILSTDCAQQIQMQLDPLGYRYGVIQSTALPELHDHIPFQDAYRNYLFMPKKQITSSL